MIDLERVGFSRKGANLVISRWHRKADEAGLWLRDIYGGAANDLYKLRLSRDGGDVPFKTLCTPACLRLETVDGYVEFVFTTPHALRVRGAGVTLELERSPNKLGGLVPAPNGCVRSILGSCKLLIRPLEGALRWEAPWTLEPIYGSWHHRAGHVRMVMGPSADKSSAEPYEFLVERYVSELAPLSVTTTFAQDREEVAADFEAWRAGAPAAPDSLTRDRDLAVYINWSSVVPAAGNFRHPTMLMSKNGMCRCWNWDNYINAWAMSYLDPTFAWNQYRLHFDHQHSQGALADGITETEVQLQYTKPPVHGWILGRMLEDQPAYGRDHLAQIYDGLAAWTRWWFTFRDDDGDGVCQYHHGNDSGWDNATIFDLEMPVESPDLMALLVRQMDFLADAANRLGRHDDAASWQQQSDDALARMVRHFWRDGQFAACQSGTHTLPSQGDCLLPHLALVAGSRLPPAQRTATVAALREPGRFLTPCGLATEALDSPLHLKKGYWRGAIWAPAMLFAIDGLSDVGETDFARDLAQRFCRLCHRHGFAENFDPVTGEGLFDPAYTWTASAFLLCLARYCPVDATSPGDGADASSGQAIFSKPLSSPSDPLK